MKRIQLALIFCFSLASLNSYASKARMQALSQNVNFGSYYFGDSRSIFKNPAWITRFKDTLLLEGGSAVNTTDAELASHAEGGIIKDFGPFVGGAYVGNEFNSLNATRRRLAGGRFGEPTFLAKDDPLDLFIAGGEEFAWGFNLQYTEKSDRQTNFFANKNHVSVLASLGFVFKRAEFYIRTVVKDRSQGATSPEDRWERKLAGTTGMAFTFSGNNTVYAEYQGDAFKYVNTGTDVFLYENKQVAFGWGKVKHINKDSRVFIDAGYFMFQEEYNNSVNIFERKVAYFPITAGFESRVRRWLTLRGSVHARYLSYTKGTAALDDNTLNDIKIDNLNQVFVNAGLSLHLGRFQLDGVIGTVQPDNAIPRLAGTSRGILALDTLGSRAAIMYFFD